MKRIQSFALALALLTPGLVAGCGSKKAADKSAANQPAPTAPAPTAPVAPTPTPPVPTAPAPTAPAGDGLKLPLAAHTVGLRWTKVDDMTSAMEVTAGDKKIPVTSKRHYRDELEILAVDAAGIVTKIKASYPERQDTEETGGKGRDKTSTLTGKSYVASSVGGKVEATLAAGGAVSPEELTELTRDLDELGKPQPMDRIVASRTWKIGEVYNFTADELAQLAAAKVDDAPSPTAMSLALREVAGDRAIFDMTSAMSTTGKAAMSIEMKGTVTIDSKTGRPVVIELGGPVTGTASGMPVTGTMTGKITYDYTAP